MNKNFSKKLFNCLIALVLIVLPAKTLAYQIEKINLTGTPAGDFILSPGKIELLMEAGEKATKIISVANRTGAEMNFKIEVEDFKGSYDVENPVVLLGEEKGPYSLKDYLKPEVSEFTLRYGEKITIPVEISIPQNAEPGGLYASVIVSANISDEQLQAKEEGVKVISRLGALFFTRVKGNAFEWAELKNFRTDKLFYEKGPITFNIAMENKGSAHLVPYGIIEIKDIFGGEIAKIEADPWFVMPDSIRTREIKWDKGWLFGRYEAVLKVNRGYGDIIDEDAVYFWILPWKILVGLLAIVLLIAGAIYYRVSRNKKKQISVNS